MRFQNQHLKERKGGRLVGASVEGPALPPGPGSGLRPLALLPRRSRWRWRSGPDCADRPPSALPTFAPFVHLQAAGCLFEMGDGHGCPGLGFTPIPPTGCIPAGLGIQQVGATGETSHLLRAGRAASSQSPANSLPPGTPPHGLHLHPQWRRKAVCGQHSCFVPTVTWVNT